MSVANWEKSSGPSVLSWLFRNVTAPRAFDASMQLVAAESSRGLMTRLRYESIQAVTWSIEGGGSLTSVRAGAVCRLPYRWAAIQFSSRLRLSAASLMRMALVRSSDDM